MKSTLELAGMNSVVEHGFSVCRVCISSPSDGESFKPMFANEGKIARKFILISGVDISFDFERQNDVLICNKCLEELNKAFDLREKIEQHEDLYFETRRLVEKVEPPELAHDEDFDSKTFSEMSETKTASEGSQHEVEGDASKRSKPKETLPHHERMSCNSQDCSKSFSSSKSLARHKTIVHDKHKPYSCPVCRKKFGMQWNLRCHLVTHIDKNASTSEIKASMRFKCDDCDEILNGKEQFTRHISEAHGKGVRKSAEAELSSCPICHRVCKNNRGMKIHKSRHGSEVDKFYCKICQRSLSSRQSLSVHNVTQHGKSKSYKCDICTLTFSAKSSLKSHNVNNHPWKDSETE